MTVDYFLKIDGIPGESTDSKHHGEINIHSWSWGETQATGPGPGGEAGRVSIQDFRISKTVDKSSPKLMLACASGQNINEAVLSCRKPGGSHNDFLTIKLTELTVSSYETAGNSGAPIDPMDQCALHFDKIEFIYVQQKPDGTMGASTQAGWDVVNNKPA
jgi:type VI secretion system secreted protein Hcp